MINITFEAIITYIIVISVTAVFIAIAADFICFDKRNDTKREKKSIVTTGTMVMFYFFYYIVLRSRFGQIYIENKLYYRVLLVKGAVLVAAGAIINILGRLQLKSNWADQIKIYENQSLVTAGVYSLVRHPLYASIMLMLFGGSIVYMNYISAILTTVIFIPFMYYRAKQEENILEQQFKNYSDYEGETGMFFPKIWRR
jgi:protein-S-isoprenylcysteine O-methyltransferase Ste14